MTDSDVLTRSFWAVAMLLGFLTLFDDCPACQASPSYGSGSEVM